MSALADFRDALAEGIARDTGALALLDRVECFADDLRGQGFGVDVKVHRCGVGQLRVIFDIDVPAGGLEDAAPPVELVEPAGGAEGEAEAASLEAVMAGRCVPATAPRTPAHRQDYSDADDDRMVDLRVQGLSWAEVAKAMGRSQKSVSVRAAKRGLAARVKSRKAQGVAVAAPAPVPVSVPAPRKDAAVDPAGPSPLEGLDPEDVTQALMRRHLLWLYGGAVDPDIRESDQELVERLARGDGAQMVAEIFDWNKAQVVDRWNRLRHHLPVTIDLQRHLLGALRALGGAA